MSEVILFSCCFMIPALCLIMIIKRDHKLWLPAVLGVITFFGSQIVCRIPLLQWLMQSSKFSFFMSFHPLIYIFFLAFTAGLFEETARWLGFTIIKKRCPAFTSALALGLGHGMCEAVLLVLLPGLQSVQVPLSTAWMAGGERLIAIGAHTAFSIIVWYGVIHQKKWLLLLAVLLHMGLDMMTGLPFAPNTLEGCLLVYTSCLWIGIYVVRKKTIETFTKRE